MMKIQSILALFAALWLAPSMAVAGDGSSLERYLPSDARAVVSIDVEALRSSGELESLMEQTGAQGQLDGVMGRLERVGFAPSQQIHTAMVISFSYSRSAQPLLIVEGDLPRAAIEDAMRAEGSATLSTVGGLEVWTRSTRGSFTFINDTTAMIGPTERVSALARGLEAGNLRAPSSLRSALAGVPRDRQVWFAAEPSSQFEGTPAEDARALRGAMNIAGGLGLLVEAQMPSSADAARVADELRGQVETAAQRDEVAALGLGPVVRAVGITSSGEQVRISLEMDASRSRRLINTLVTVVREEMR